MKYTAHREWLLSQPQTAYVKDLLALVDQAQAQPAFNAVEYNNDSIHLKIEDAIRLALFKEESDRAMFNPALHGVAGFGIDPITLEPFIINWQLSEIQVKQFEATDAGLENILNAIKGKRYNLLKP